MLLQALQLLERPAGPVLEEFPFDADESSLAAALPACPVDFRARGALPSAAEQLLDDFAAELAIMHSWYSLAREHGQRTTAGVSGLRPTQIAELFRSFVLHREIPSFGTSLSGADLLRLAAEDLKACYFEALAAQPGASRDAAQLADWFWGETVAAAVINAVRLACLGQESKEMVITGRLLLVPRNQVYRFEG